MLKLNGRVRLLTDCLGVPLRTDHDVLLPGGSDGTVIEARSPETVIVEFLAMDGDVLAWASIAANRLQRLA